MKPRSFSANLAARIGVLGVSALLSKRPEEERLSRLAVHADVL